MKTAMLIGITFFITVGLMALTGYGTSAPVMNDTIDPTLILSSPNGGEIWYIGDTNDILWSASDTNLEANCIYLWYSLSSGSEYLPLAEAIANSGSYPWEMPSTQSHNARVKIQATDSFGNSRQVNSAGTFTISYVPPATPTGLNVDISNGSDAIITWQPVTQTVYDTPITPDGYIVLYNESPYEHDEHFYYFLYETDGLSFTHPRVARFRDQMFYKVVAYKDYSGRLGEVLTYAKAHPEQKLSLKDIQARIYGGEK